MLTFDQTQAFERDGFVLLNDVFSPREVEILLTATETSARMTETAWDVTDAAGRSSKLAFWGDVRADAFGAVTTSPRVVNNARMLLREDVYHWHSKMSVKQPRTGGAWEWHQDYGYWYGDTCLYPRMISCMIALDPCTRQNGCLKVIVGSHLLGRLDHGRVGGQSGADPARVEAVINRLPVHYCEAPAGSVLFFHCNLFHSSEPNTSEIPRRAYICCYNALSNLPYDTAKGHGAPQPITVSPDEAILQFGQAATAV
jgi:ectoine hydroxylase-related dioxygenase (phytanoyl-CoA dioxygenase family)